MMVPTPDTHANSYPSFVTVSFNAADTPPPTPAGATRDYLVIIWVDRFQEFHTVMATHLNNFPMFCNDDGDPICDECPDDGSHENGCPVSGWGQFMGSDAECVHDLLRPEDRLIAWAEFPKFPWPLSIKAE